MSPPAASPASSGGVLALVEHALEHARHVLPAQGPLGVFVHHNTLHAYQSRPFHEAIAEACAEQDAQGYLSEERFRDELRRGRIDEVDVAHALSLRDHERVNRAIGASEVRDVERLMLVHAIEEVPSTIRFVLEEAGVLDVPEQRALFEVARRVVDATARPSVAHPDERTIPDLLRALGAPDPALVPNAFLQRFLAAFLDQGVARWTMPGRERGLLACAGELLTTGDVALPPLLRDAGRALGALARTGRPPLALAVELLTDLGYIEREEPTADVAAHRDATLDRRVARHLLQQAGFAGMVARLEAFPDERGPDGPPVSLAELLVVRWVPDRSSARVSARAVAAEVPRPAPRAQLAHIVAQRAANRREDESLARAFRLFEVARLLGLTSHDLAALDLPERDDDAAAVLLRSIEAFDGAARRRAFHEAYEHHHLREIAAALAHNRDLPAAPASPVPRFQAAFCIDDREEGIRRHFEAQGRDHVTFGVAGFFGVAMQFRSLDTPFASAQCPVVVTPAHAVHEAADPAEAHLEARRRGRRALWARVRHETLDASRSLTRGALLTAVLGVFALIPLVLRVAFPRWTDRTGKRIGAWLLPSPRTRLSVARPVSTHDSSDHEESEHAHEHEPDPAALSAGFTADERVQRVRGTLENMGLTSGFAPLVALLGHGASSVNNPHQSAYDCGACGGRNGGPNARAFAAMANDPEVRAGLRTVGIDVPDSTWFIGGVHDTTTDAVALLDTDLVPGSLREDLRGLRAALDEARRSSAHERCRRFEHADDDLDVHAALRHVEERAVDLSQARPEYNHATNAVCIVGRRGLTRGLFLDRRSFLVSYDPAIDDDGSILARILGAVVPVGAGINLEYLFSTVDPQVWGAGSKLPHNLAALLGVMEGASGDLRTGLPEQMTEIHEPIRLLCVLEASVDVIAEVVRKNAELRELVTGHWVRVLSMDPDTGELQYFGRQVFERYEAEHRPPPEVQRWDHWYGGKLGHLGPARLASPERASGRAELRA